MNLNRERPDLITVGELYGTLKDSDNTEVMVVLRDGEGVPTCVIYTTVDPLMMGALIGTYKKTSEKADQ